MGKYLAIGLIVIGLVLAGFGGFSYWQSHQPTAGLKIETNIPSLVFVDNLQVGQTPIEKTFIPGEVSLKIIPTSTSSALPSYQTKVKLTSQVYTVVRRDFGETDVLSAGDIISLEPQSIKTASLSVVTASPESASVTLDGQPQGFTPLLIASIIPGSHEITVSSPGYVDRSSSITPVAGYKLNVNVKLAGVMPTPQPTPVPEATSSASLKGYVTITDTPTKFLRVRATASTGAKELGKVYPGDKYKVLNSKTGWYQIQVDLDATNSGWISSTYAKSN